MSSALVVLNARLPGWLRCTQTKDDGVEWINTKTAKWTQALYSCRSLGYAGGNKSIIFFNNLCKLIEIYIYVRTKHPFTSYPAEKHPKQQTCGYRHTTKTSGLFYWHRTGADYSSHNNFANLGSFAKVSIPVGSIIPWLQGCQLPDFSPRSQTFCYTADFFYIFKTTTFLHIPSQNHRQAP